MTGKKKVLIKKGINFSNSKTEMKEFMRNSNYDNKRNTSITK